MLPCIVEHWVWFPAGATSVCLTHYHIWYSTPGTMIFWSSVFIEEYPIGKNRSVIWDETDTGIWPVETCDNYGITSQGITMIPPLFATSWYLQTWKDSRCSEVLTRPESWRQTTWCKVLQALTIGNNTSGSTESHYQKQLIKDSDKKYMLPWS